MNRDAIERLLASRRTEERLRALEWIEANSDTAWTPALLDALEDKSPYARGLAAKTLAQVTDWTVADRLLEQFDRLLQNGPGLDPGGTVRSHLAFALGRLEYRQAEESLRRGIKTYEGFAAEDPAKQIRANCALALAEM